MEVFLPFLNKHHHRPPSPFIFFSFFFFLLLSSIFFIFFFLLLLLLSSSFFFFLLLFSSFFSLRFRSCLAFTGRTAGQCARGDARAPGAKRRSGHRRAPHDHIYGGRPRRYCSVGRAESAVQTGCVPSCPNPNAPGAAHPLGQGSFGFFF